MRVNERSRFKAYVREEPKDFPQSPNAGDQLALTPGLQTALQDLSEQFERRQKVKNMDPAALSNESFEKESILRFDVPMPLFE